MRILSLAVGVVIGGSNINWSHAAEVRASGKNADTQPVSMSLPPTFSLTYGKSTTLCVTVLPISKAGLANLTVSKPEAIFSKERIVDPTCAGAAFELKSSPTVSSCDQIEELKVYAALSGSVTRKAESVGRLIRPVHAQSDFLENHFCSDLDLNGKPIFLFRPIFGGIVEWRVTIVGNDANADFNGLFLNEEFDPRPFRQFSSTGAPKPLCNTDPPKPHGRIIGEGGLGVNTSVDNRSSCRSWLYPECYTGRIQILKIGNCTLPKRGISVQVDNAGDFNTSRSDAPGGLLATSPTITAEKQREAALANFP